MIGVEQQTAQREGQKMTERAHPVGCKCGACLSAFTPEQRAAMADKPAGRDWEKDAKEVGKLHSQTGKNLWHAAYLVAVNTEPSKGGRPSKETANSTVAVMPRVSFRQFAKQAGITDVTVGRYYATWQAAAERGLVPEASLLSKAMPASMKKLTADDWSENYPKREISAPVTSVSGSIKASGAKAPSRASRSAAQMAKDRTPDADSPKVSETPTDSPKVAGTPPK